jgi:hypothetical protein
MGLSRWLFNDWFTAVELDRIDARHFRELSRYERDGQRQDRQIVELREDVGKLKADGTLDLRKVDWES